MRTHLIYLFLILITACSSSGNSEQAPVLEELYEKEGTYSEESEFADLSDEEEFNDTPLPQKADPASNASSIKTPVKRKRIYTADYRIQVEDVESSTEQIKSLVNEVGGFISNVNLTNSSYSISNSITIRVPNEQFDSLLNNIGQEAVFTYYRRINTKDVTQEFTDIEIRLQTKKDVRDRYIDILRNKAKTVKDVLQAEEVIRTIQEEIEVQEGRMRYLKDQIGLSTINLELYQEVEVKNEPTIYKDTFARKAGNSLKDGWEMIQYFFFGFLSIWPLIIILSLLIWQRKRIFRRKK